MTMDALMRWEWEGGAPAVPDRDQVMHTRPAQNTHLRSQPANARQKARRAASSPPTWRRWRSDDSARDRRLMARVLLVLASLAVVLGSVRG